MSQEVSRYRQHLAQLAYPEYALTQADESQIQPGIVTRLDLSLWNDDIPPGLAEVIQHALRDAVGSYRLAQDTALIDVLSQRLGVDGEAIIITAGADDALRIAAAYSIRPGTKTLIPVPSFGRYTYHAMIGEAKIYHVPFGSYPFEFDAGKLCAIIREEKIECLIIGNPNSPTGHALSIASIKRLIDDVSCSIILDESLLLGPLGAGYDILAQKHQNLFVCGSFSKLYGVPGLRIGYLVAAREHAQGLKKLTSPFEVDALSIEIAKHMAVQDDWLRGRVAAIKSGIAELRRIDSPTLRVTRTSAPVALLEYSGVQGDLYDMLRARGVATVAGKEFLGLDQTNAVRVIIKNVKDMLQLKEILANIS